MALTVMASAMEATQLPSEPTTKQQVKVAFVGLALGWLAFPSLVAGDVQWLSLQKKGKCTDNNMIVGYFPVPTQRGVELQWLWEVPCTEWNNTNNVVVRSPR